jgi:hypothetical protein
MFSISKYIQIYLLKEQSDKLLKNHNVWLK